MIHLYTLLFRMTDQKEESTCLGQMEEKKIGRRPLEKKELNFHTKKICFIAQGVKIYFHEIYFVKNIFEESVKKNIVSDEKNRTI